MLDVSLRNVSALALRDVTVTFPKSTHTAILGPSGAGASTLLRVLAGTLKPQSGEVLIGTRVVNAMKPAKRPLLFVTNQLDVPGRWSVQHALIAAVRTRSLDREDRHHEYALAVEKWDLERLLERRIDTLSSTEATLVHLARIELLRPGIVVADRLLADVNPSRLVSVADEIFRTLRVLSTTVITAPSSREELAQCDQVVVLEEGRIVQRGSAFDVFTRPHDDAAAIATGEINVLPVTIRGNVVESVIGEWDVSPPPFQGSGVALIRPTDFALARPGEDSDFIFGIEEAGFTGGAWHCRGILTGGLILRVVLPGDAPVHKGKLVPLRYPPERIRLLARDVAVPGGVPTNVVPALRDSR